VLAHVMFSMLEMCLNSSLVLRLSMSSLEGL